MQNWITVKDLANIQGVTPRAVRKAVNQKKYVTRLVDGKTGSKYEILVQSLSDDNQNLIDFEKNRFEIEKKREPKLRKNDKIPPHALQIALARYDLVNLWVDYRNRQENITEAGKDFIAAYNCGDLYPILFNVVGKVSIGTIYRWYKKIKGNSDYKLLIPNYDYGEKESSAALTADEELVFKSLLLSPNKINIGKATKLTKFILNKKGIESPSCERTFRRYAENLKRNHYADWIFAREGQKALRDKVQPYITRDVSKIDVGDILVADGHRLAVQCINPFTGRPCRPTLIGYLDWKSTALVGYEIMLEENTQAISSSLRNAIINLGKIPKICYQDNGKAFRAKFFTGDFQESGINGLFNKLNITAVFAQPYNARAKVIERFFRELQDGFERLLPSFVGSGISDKPAYMHNPILSLRQDVNREYKNYIEEILTSIRKDYMKLAPKLAEILKDYIALETMRDGDGTNFACFKIDDINRLPNFDDEKHPLFSYQYYGVARENRGRVREKYNIPDYTVHDIRFTEFIND